MSTPSPQSLTGSYTRESLEPLLRRIQQQQQSGVLQLTTSAGSGNLHFIQGKLAAADFAGLMGVSAFQGIAATSAGQYEFRAGFVQFSQIGMDKRIHASLESLLSAAPLEDAAALSAEPPPSFNLEAFDLEALSEQASLDPAEPAATMNQGFNQALLSEFVRSVGPAAYVLIEEIALDLRIDVQAMTSAQAARLTAALLAQVPIAKRGAFQSSCAALLERFKA